MRPQLSLRAVRPSAVAGALTLATAVPAVAAPIAAAPSPGDSPDGARIDVAAPTHHVAAGRKLVVDGALHSGGGDREVALQVSAGRGWRSVARAHTDAAGGFRLAYRATRPGESRLRVSFSGDDTAGGATRAAGRLLTYRS